MEDFKDALEAIAGECSGSPVFKFESVQMMNLVADGIASTTPVIFAPILGLGKFRVAGAGIIPVETIIVEFLQQTQFEANFASNQSIIQSMFLLAVDFIQHLRADTTIQLVKPEGAIHRLVDIQHEYVYETFDANYAGIMITFDAELRKPIKACE